MTTEVQILAVVLSFSLIFIAVLYIHLGKLKKQFEIYKETTRRIIEDVAVIYTDLNSLELKLKLHINSTKGDVWTDITSNKTHVLTKKHTHEDVRDKV